MGRSAAFAVLVMVCVTLNAVLPVTGAAVQSATAIIVPACSPLYVGESDVPYAITVYFYAVNPSPYELSVTPMFSTSAALSLLSAPSSVELPAFSAVQIPVTLNVGPGSTPAYVNYTVSGQAGEETLKLVRLPIPLQGVLIQPSSSYYIGAPGSGLRVSLIFSSPVSLSLSSDNVSFVVSGEEIHGYVSLPSDSPSAVFIYPVFVTGQVRGRDFALTSPIIVSAVCYSGDGLAMNYASIGEVTQMPNVLSYRDVGPLYDTQRAITNTTEYFVLNFTKAPASFWLALNRTHPYNLSYSSGRIAISGSGPSLEGWVHSSTVFMFAFNSTKPMSWKVDVDGNSTGWLPTAPSGGFLGLLLLTRPLLWLVVVAVVAVIALAVFLARRKRGWPYTSDRYGSWKRDSVILANAGDMARYTPGFNETSRSCYFSTALVHRLWPVRSAERRKKARVIKAVNYPALKDGASRFIDTLTPGLPRVFHPASQRRSHPRASPLRSIGKAPFGHE